MRKDHATGELPLIGGVFRRPAPLSDEEIAGFGENEEVAIQAAVITAWRRRRVQAMSRATAAALCGITPQHFSLIVSGSKYLGPHKINAFEDVVGNTAVSQTIAHFRRLRDERARCELADEVARQMLRSA